MLAVHVLYYHKLSPHFRDHQPFFTIPLASIMLRTDDGNFRFVRDYMSILILPLIWESIEDLLAEYGGPKDIVSTVLTTLHYPFQSDCRATRVTSLWSYLWIINMNNSSTCLDSHGMRDRLVAFHQSEHYKLCWELLFARSLAHELRVAFKTSPELMACIQELENPTPVGSPECSLSPVAPSTITAMSAPSRNLPACHQ
jgi:hypothetical protein